MDGDGTVHVGAMRLDVHLPGVTSLKGKRALLNRAKAALQRDLGVSVAEVGHQDVWQRAALGITVAASSEDGVDRVLERATAVVERDPRVVVLRTASMVDLLEPDAPTDDPQLPAGW